MTRGVPLLLAACCFVLLGAGTARASCTISATPVVFGTYDVFSPSPRDSTGTVTFECSKIDKRIRITLTKGSSPTYERRRMTNGTDWLEYNLFLDAFVTVWGDGSGATGFYYDNNPPNDKAVSLPIYGRIFAGQDVSAGLYADSVQVQIDF